jgi:hypothetical protein
MPLMRFCISHLRVLPSAAINEALSFHKPGLLQSQIVSVPDPFKSTNTIYDYSLCQCLRCCKIWPMHHSAG